MPHTNLHAAASHSLPAQIAAATRPYHTTLNRCITTRLPLCLPPYTTSPSVYAAGLSAFAEIYYTFERSWTELASLTASCPPLQSRHLNILRALHIPELRRAERLRADIAILKTRSLTTSICSVQFDSSTISSRIREKPYLVIAYAWIMYMALFNGGRWIRGQLRGAGADFWLDSAQSPTTREGSRSRDEAEIDCLTFWEFDAETDGEKYKEDFKARIDMVAELLTEEERRDIVNEAVKIFELCGELVDELDKAVVAQDMAPSALWTKPTVAWQWAASLGSALTQRLSLSFKGRQLAWFGARREVSATAPS